MTDDPKPLASVAYGPAFRAWCAFYRHAPDGDKAAKLWRKMMPSTRLRWRRVVWEIRTIDGARPYPGPQIFHHKGGSNHANNDAA